MHGKTLKVAEYNLTFGAGDRFVNVFGFFKYKKNGNLYVLYSDVNTNYEIVYYGSSHEKNNNLLSMSCKEEESEIIKEFIYKLVNNEPLDNFEVYTLENINGIELISSNKLEVKLEIIRKLEELTINKKEDDDNLNINETNNTNKKKKKSIKAILLLLILIIVMGGGYFFTTIINSDKIVKSINCTKTYNHDKLDVTVYEDNIYKFNKRNQLKLVDSKLIYKFNAQSDYENFINNGSIYSYMPEYNKEFNQ